MKKYPVRRFNIHNKPIGKKFKLSIAYRYYHHKDIILLTSGDRVIVWVLWIKRNWQILTIIIIQILGTIALVIFLGGCISQKPVQDGYKTFRYNQVEHKK